MYSNYLHYFPGPDSNVPLTEGDLINILNQMGPAQWRRSMTPMALFLSFPNVHELEGVIANWCITMVGSVWALG